MPCRPTVGNFRKRNSYCRRRFAHNPGFIGKRHAPAAIADALDRYAGGMRAEAIVQNMRKNGIPVSERTLRRRFVEYRDLLERYVGSLTVQAGRTWHADEIQYRAGMTADGCLP